MVCMYKKWEIYDIRRTKIKTKIVNSKTDKNKKKIKIKLNKNKQI